MRLVWMGLVVVPLSWGCARANPSFGDDDAETDADGTAGAVTDSGASGVSASTSASTTTTGPDSTSTASSSSTTDASTTDAGTGGSTGTDVVACSPGLGMLGMAILDAQDQPVDDDALCGNPLFTLWGPVADVTPTSITMTSCGDCDCDLGDPRFTLELGWSQMHLANTTALPCAQIVLHAFYDQLSCVLEGYTVRYMDGDPEGEIVLAGYNYVPADAPWFGGPAVTVLHKADCGELTENCPAPGAHGEFEMWFDNAGPVRPGDSAEVGGGPTYAFTNRWARANVDGLCGEEMSWTAELIPPG